MKSKAFLICAMSLFILTSCDSYYEDPDVVNANREAVTDISGSVAADSALTSASEIVTDSTENVDATDDNNSSSENNLFGIDRQHDITVNGEVITLQTSYKIPKSRIDNYLYTIPTGIELSIKVLNFPNDRYTVKISNLYTDVSILSNVTKFSGLRQDSMNLNFTTLPSGGYLKCLLMDGMDGDMEVLQHLTLIFLKMMLEKCPLGLFYNQFGLFLLLIR